MTHVQNVDEIMQNVMLYRIGSDTPRHTAVVPVGFLAFHECLGIN